MPGVIAYDSLSQLIVRDLAKDPSLIGVPLEKVKGLLTFGCALNKVVYFFRARTNLRTNVLSQVLYTLHSFRLRTPLPPEANPEMAVPHPVLAQREMEKGRSSLVHRFRPFGAGIF